MGGEEERERGDDVMQIGLVDVDGHNFPNIALMKISAWHKQQGDHVEMVFPMASYDRVYMSKVFDFSPDFDTCIDTKEIIKGGRAYDKKLKLPTEIEHMYPDYNLYNITDTAYGYLTRGCPRACEFCDVVNLEGRKSIKVANLDNFWNDHKNIVLLDPNITACKDRIELLNQLADSQAWIDFTQGLDIRFMTEDVAEIIGRMKIKMLHFAWDKLKDSKQIINKLTEFKAITKLDFRRLGVYVLVNFNSTIDDDLYRIYKLKELGYDPYVMVYDKDKFVNKKTKIMYPINQLLKIYTMKQIKHFKVCWKLQRWVNNKIIFRSCEQFENYNPSMG